ncbi:MAG: metallophosphoesterase [Methanomicrobiales archaeon]|nr:metallophosphoesterase [Methanomicrobiales archaeon]
MTDVLLLADLHGRYGHMDAFLDLNPDMLIIAGDLTDCGPVDPVRDLLDRIDIPSFAVPGNCDRRELIDIVEASETVCLHGTSIEIGAITLTGIGGSNPTPFDTPFELSEEEIDRMLSAAIARSRRNVHNVLVAHAPPEGTLDCIGGAHVGSTSLRKHLKNFDLICCAHIHEAKGVMECDGVKVVNPGQAGDGDCAMIRFGPEAGDIKIELLSV